jgi:Phosphotransferase enzyme family
MGDERPEEVPLVGGWVSDGVVRVGDTVRRPAGAGSAVVAELLKHLESVGFDAVPRFLGYDEGGREMLTFIQGETPSDCGSIIWSDEQLGASMRLLRKFHDCTAGSALAGAAEVICHNDYGPWNLIWQADTPVAIIDFDTAAPGARLDDLGYAAWKFLNLGLVEVPVSEQRRRLRVLTESYGTQPDSRLLVAIHAAQNRMRQLIVAPEDDRERLWLDRDGRALIS